MYKGWFNRIFSRREIQNIHNVRKLLDQDKNLLLQGFFCLTFLLMMLCFWWRDFSNRLQTELSFFAPLLFCGSHSSSHQIVCRRRQHISFYKNGITEYTMKSMTVDFLFTFDFIWRLIWYLAEPEQDMAKQSCLPFFINLADFVGSILDTATDFLQVNS